MMEKCTPGASPHAIFCAMPQSGAATPDGNSAGLTGKPPLLPRPDSVTCASLAGAWSRGLRQVPRPRLRRTDSDWANYSCLRRPSRGPLGNIGTLAQEGAATGAVDPIETLRADGFRVALNRNLIGRRTAQ